MAHGCYVTLPSESGWSGEQMETAQTSCVTPGEMSKQHSVKTHQCYCTHDVKELPLRLEKFTFSLV